MVKGAHMAAAKRNFDQYYNEALSKAGDLQTWPGYFLTKKTETEIIFDKFELNDSSAKLALEVGCGNAFQATLLSDVFSRVIAVDLFRDDPVSHTVGMPRAKKLLSVLGNKKVSLVGCSFVSLPFPDDHFDFVFTSSSLEHVADKDRAVREMLRVVKPGGDIIVVVPTHMPCLYAFPHVFLYFIARIGKILLWSNNKLPRDDGAGAKAVQEDSLFRKFRKNHPSFPFPEPHGSYVNIREELAAQFPSSWISLLIRNGMAVSDSMAIGLVPWLLIEPFSTSTASRIFDLSAKVNRRVAGIKWMQYFSYLVGIRGTKNKPAVNTGGCLSHEN